VKLPDNRRVQPRPPDYRDPDPDKYIEPDTFLPDEYEDDDDEREREQDAEEHEDDP
jgi:hypothetical protein